MHKNRTTRTKERKLEKYAILSSKKELGKLKKNFKKKFNYDLLIHPNSTYLFDENYIL